MTILCAVGSRIVGALSAKAIVVNANKPSTLSLVSKTQNDGRRKRRKKKTTEEAEGDGREDTYSCDDLSFNTELILKASCDIIESSSAIRLCIWSMSNRVKHMPRCEQQDCNLQSVKAPRPNAKTRAI